MMVRRYAAVALVLALGLGAAFTTNTLCAQDANPAVKPLNRDIPRHKQFLKIVEKGEGDVIFLGDSITQGWEGAGKKAWAEHFAPLKAVNLGIGGDQTGHVLWRITEGKELEPIKPKVAVIMIGTNNTGGHSAEQIAGGIKAIVEELRKQKPEMKILLLGVFPRPAASRRKTSPHRPKSSTRRSRRSTTSSPSSTTARWSSTRTSARSSWNRTVRLSRKVMPDLLHL